MAESAKRLRPSIPVQHDQKQLTREPLPALSASADAQSTQASNHCSPRWGTASRVPASALLVAVRHAMAAGLICA
jgi:hypothetical protein